MKEIKLTREVALDLTKKLAESESYIYSATDLNLFFKKKIIKAMVDGRFQDALPQEYIDQINQFFRDCINSGKTKAVVSILLDDNGLASFLYEPTMTNFGIVSGSSLEYFVPNKSSDRRIPRDFSGFPHMAINVSASI